jgi:hypothetical protein
MFLINFLLSAFKMMLCSEIACQYLFLNHEPTSVCYSENVPSISGAEILLE